MGIGITRALQEHFKACKQPSCMGRSNDLAWEGHPSLALLQPDANLLTLRGCCTSGSNDILGARGPQAAVTPWSTSFGLVP